MARKPFIKVKMLPARHGDCLWVEYGQDSDINRILIDGGPVSTWPALKKQIGNMPAGDKAFELIVLTHVDADHVEGLVRLFAEKPLPISVDNVWFNGWRQMKKHHGLLGPVQGEFLSTLLVDRVPYAWSPDDPVIAVKTRGNLPVQKLDGGMILTILSPNVPKLELMAKTWEKSVRGVGLRPGDLEAAWLKLSSKKKFLPRKGLLGVTDELDSLLEKQFRPDSSRANGSSIAFLAEYAGKSVLFLGDAHPAVITDSIERLCKQRGIDHLPVNAVKISHHGSKGNTTKALLNCIDSKRFLISTNGDQFDHPDKECIARIIDSAPNSTLYFNYKSTFNKFWLSEIRQKSLKYSAITPIGKNGGLTVRI